MVFSADDWKSLRALVKDDAFGDLPDFMWETGCRPLEATIMPAKHVERAAGLVIFPASEAKDKKHERVLYLAGSYGHLISSVLLSPTNPSGLPPMLLVNSTKR